MRFFQQNTTLLARLGYFILIVVLLILSLICLEYFIGNGDAVWFDYDLRLVGFRAIAWTVAAVVFYLVIRKSPPIIQNIFISLLSIAFVIWGVEATVGFLQNTNQAKPTGLQYEGPSYDSSYAFDEHLGRKPIPNMEFRWLKKLKDKPVIDFVAHADSLSRRITPFADSATKRNQYALFFGCSFTFGDAVADNETMPYFFQKQNTDFQAYNYAFFGYSPRHTLARLQHFDLTKQVAQKQGFAVYTYIEDHVNRSIPSVGWVGMYDGLFPNLDTDKMQTNGIYKFLHPLAYRLNMMLFQSKTRRYFGMDFPFKYRPNDYKLTADLIKASRDAYQKQFNNDRFYVIVYPDAIVKDSPMIALLKERGLKVLDYRKLFPFPSKQYQLQHDGHPNPEAHRLLMAQLSKDILK